MKIDKVFIIIKDNPNGSIRFMESVWSSMELARSGILYHAHTANASPEEYSIIERDINQAKRHND